MLKNQHNILFVDDELDNLKLLERAFRESHTIHLADSPQAAFELLDKYEISLIISDQRMPEMSGLEFLTEVKRRSPNTIRYLLNGLTDADEIKAALSSELIFGYIVKPFKVADLKITVNQSLSYFELKKENHRLEVEWQQAVDELSFLFDSINRSNKDREKVLDSIVKAICTRFNYQACAIELIDKTSWELYKKASYGFPEDVMSKRLPIEGEAIVSYVARTGKMLYVADTTKDNKYTSENGETRSQLTIPLRIGEDIIGVLSIESLKPDDFSGRNIFILSSFADKAAGIIQQTHLFDLVSRGKIEWESTFDAMADAVFIFDRKKRLRRVNSAGAKLFEQEYDQLLGEYCCNLFPDERLNGCLTQKMFIKETRIVEEQRFREHYILITADPVFDENRQIIGSVLTVRDQKKLSQDEAESRLQKDFLANLMENAFDLVLVLGKDGKVVWANARALQYLGMDLATLNNTSFENLVLEEQTEQVRTACRRASTGDALSFEVSLYKAADEDSEDDEETSQITVNYSPVISNGSVTHVLVIGRDAAIQKPTEEPTAEAEKLRALGQIASGVAHDFNNILAAILGRSQLMQKRLQDPELVRNLQVIERAARDGARMTQRIRDFARPKNHTQNFGTLELSELITEAIDVTAPRWKDDANKAGRFIEVEFHPESEVNVQGDASELREVLTNLILNSVDALPNGGKIRLEYGRKNDLAFIKVIDNGNGIPKEVQSHIFEPFFTTKGERGTGLGLNVSQSIIMNHGGLIEVESEPGRGTTMLITLPLTKPPELPVTHMPAVAEPKSTPTSRILVVDDEEDVRELLADILCSFGHEAVTAESGTMALDILQHKDFHLLVTDLGMPGMNGSELAERAKQLRPGLPVILCTGWGESVDTSQLKTGLINLIISKPFDMEQIANALAQMLVQQP